MQGEYFILFYISKSFLMSKGVTEYTEYIYKRNTLVGDAKEM